ncbi:hypothetical protein [Pelagicoccus sp. SDUM812005]|uniref:hypothetical protein n=1 Tax=Pelagicoccus sp. SDUM812005 TaxID=3041257 RepID=UPI00280F3D4A|nr:hypothetical protein [Pelagicoccus sp. SDUM812005]MDQ8183468.1 hypothetical protein [Pelagicoccus sp. SDUM812005]
MNLPLRALSLASACVLSVSISFAQENKWTNEGGSNNFVDPRNWSAGAVPAGEQAALINLSKEDKAVFNSESNENLNGLNVGSKGRGEFWIANGKFTATKNAARGTAVGLRKGVGVMGQLGGEAHFNYLQLGIGKGSSGAYTLRGGDLMLARAKGDFSLYVGDGGKGSFEIRGGSLKTRRGVVIGNNGGVGGFTVQGSSIAEIGIGSHNKLDGSWVQNASSVLKAVVDEGGITKIFIDDTDNDGEGGDVTFEKKSVLDCDFAGPKQSGSWVLMEWEGKLLKKGLVLSPEAKKAGWSFSFEDRGVNGKVKGPDALVIRFKKK